MKKVKPDEFEKFDETMDKLLAVPYSVLQKKLEEEKKQKAKSKAVKKQKSERGNVRHDF